jgi:hypothetical protein
MLLATRADIVICSYEFAAANGKAVRYPGQVEDPPLGTGDREQDASPNRARPSSLLPHRSRAPLLNPANLAHKSVDSKLWRLLDIIEPRS